MSEAKRLAAEKAIEYVEDGMIVGVGTGSTVAYFIDALAASSTASRAPCPAPSRAPRA
jgi:ribose 5-phosphate isomerase